MQAVLVGFDGERVVRAVPVQVMGMVAGGVQGVGGDHHVGQGQRVQQRRQ
ncbi:hypothetical protein [Actinophytocola sp.]